MSSLLSLRRCCSSRTFHFFCVRVYVILKVQLPKEGLTIKRWHWIVIGLALLVAIANVTQMTLSKQSCAYNEWLDQRAYSHLAKQLMTAKIDRPLLSMDQQIVQSDDADIFQDISYDNSPWNDEHKLQNGIMIITVDLSQFANIRLFDSGDPTSDIFKVWYNKRWFAVKLPELKKMVNELRPLFKKNYEPGPEQTPIRLN